MTTNADAGQSAQTLPPTPTSSDTNRTVLFIVIQGVFLLVSPVTGGFHYRIWSMLDSALLLLAIGVTALVLVLDTPPGRKLALKAGILLYILGIFDMSLNVLVSGWVGWKPM